ncbi:DegV family protein [Granulicatella adiacens ATCC 49175]|uniref:EDD domain protein, DegV family n=2 Tax=Granulicatella TaxID=117563 RepID=C8NEU6_9LACT|nr:DegV family protein [Granulicatella adiacens]EEW37800.1 EDD domain protein, DegV family [Granulicatella adiacens ATCC 49175]UAK93684.1 DegV family protein [Granulicatella adiacens]UWP37316.1 DegV family protein [Granulicatella adiacens ATCC 49175]
MSRVYIVTDSTADLTEEEVKQFEISIVPMNISIDDENYIDGVTITKDEFKQKMIASSELPKTAQPSIGRFVEVYDELGKNADSVISIQMMRSISGTVDAARQAADITETNVKVVDSDFTSRSMGMIVKEAAKAAQEGKTVEEILEIVEDAKKRTTLYLTVVNLDNLIKGGRISQLMGMFSNLLNIKLFLQVIHGKIEIIQKGRGLKSLQKKYDEIFEEMKAVPSGIQEIGIMHAGLSEFNEGNIARVRELFPNVPLTIVTTSPIIMSHTGVDAMAITYLENK